MKFIAITAILAITACAMPRVECTTDQDCEVRVAEELKSWADSMEMDCDTNQQWRVCHEDQVKTILHKEKAIAVIDGKMMIWTAPEVESMRVKENNISWTWGDVTDSTDDGIEILTNDEGVVIDTYIY